MITITFKGGISQIHQAIATKYNLQSGQEIESAILYLRIISDNAAYSVKLIVS